MEQAPRRAVLYARKSKYQGDDQSKSVTDQLADCRRYAEARGWTVVAELKDDGKSGVTLPWSKRPDFAQAVEMFEAGDADTFVTLWTSRLSRDENDRRALPTMLASLGVQWHAVDDGGLIETETYDGFTRDAVRYLIDVGESKRKSEMWKAAQRRRIEKGLPSSGQPRFGYVKTDDGAFAPDPVTGPVLRDMYLRYTAGAGFMAICADLNQRGVTTLRGSDWIIQTLQRTMDSGFGAGLLIQGQKDREVFTEGAHEPVITEAEWTAYRDARDGRRQVAPRRRTAKWYLAGLAICGVCGDRVIVTTHKTSKSQALCSGYHNKRSCSGVWIKRQTLEGIVTNWIGANIEAVPEREVATSSAESDVADLLKRLEASGAVLARLATGWASGILDDTGYRLAQAEELEEQRQIELALKAARAEAAKVRPLSQDEWSRLELGDAATPGEWNALLARAIRHVEVWKDRVEVVPVVGERWVVGR